jgi:hypothetical protein
LGWLAELLRAWITALVVTVARSPNIAARA